MVEAVKQIMNKPNANSNHAAIRFHLIGLYIIGFHTALNAF